MASDSLEESNRIFSMEIVPMPWETMAEEAQKMPTLIKRF
jgi:hypothetical protein